MNTAQLVCDDFFDVSFDDSYLPYYKAAVRSQRDNPANDNLTDKKYYKIGLKGLLKLQCYGVIIQRAEDTEFIQPIMKDSDKVRVFLCNDHKMQEIDTFCQQDHSSSENYNLIIDTKQEYSHPAEMNIVYNPTHVVIVADRVYITELSYGE